MIITILVVQIVEDAERKKVRIAIRQRSARFDLVFITLRTQLNPPFWSTISTMVIAPIRKKSVVAVSPRCSWMIPVTFSTIHSTACIIRVHQLEILHWIHRLVEGPNNLPTSIRAIAALFYLSQELSVAMMCIAEHENDNNRNCKCSSFLFIYY